MTSFLPMLVLSKPYFAGAIEMGQISQAGMAYGTVLNALSLVTSNVDGLTAFAAESARLAALLAALRSANNAGVVAAAATGAGAPAAAGAAAAGGAAAGGGGGDGGAAGAGPAEREMQPLVGDGMISRGYFGGETEEVLRVERLSVRATRPLLLSLRFSPVTPHRTECSR